MAHAMRKEAFVSDAVPGTYGSQIGNGVSQWNGSFTLDSSGNIHYTRSDGNAYDTTNTSQGNAIVFSITADGVTVRFNGPTYSQQGNGKAKYTGNFNDGRPTAGQQSWTATQT